MLGVKLVLNMFFSLKKYFFWGIIYKAQKSLIWSTQFSIIRMSLERWVGKRGECKRWRVSVDGLKIEIMEFPGSPVV